MTHRTRLRLLVNLAALPLLWGCASTVPAAQHEDGPLSGAWLMTVHPGESLGAGNLRTVLFFEPRGTGEAFEAHSRPGAVRDLVGPMQAAMASVAGGEAFARGALVHLYDGAVVPAGDSFAVTGRMVTKSYGTLQLTGGLADGRLRGVLRGQRTGAVVAWVEAEPYRRALPVENYAALVPEMRAVVAQRYYAPNDLASEPWTTFWPALENRLERAEDDLEAISQFRIAAADLAVSHFGLQRAAPEERSAPKDASAAGASLMSGVTFSQRPDSVAVLTCLDFVSSQATPVLDGAFAEMAARPPRALVVDLRSCSGGDFSSMLVAAHLLDEPAAGGLFLSNRWWATHTAPPPRETWSGLATLTDPSLAAFFRDVAAEGALVASVVPKAPTYRGPVYVLTSENTGSAAEPLAHLLKTTGRATLVGAPTAGAMLASTMVPFGDGWTMVVPVADYFTAEGTRLEGVGVPPSIAADPLVALETALAHSRQSRSF